MYPSQNKIELEINWLTLQMESTDIVLLYSKGSRSECKQRSNKGSPVIHYLNSGHKSPANPRCPPTLSSKISWYMLMKPGVSCLTLICCHPRPPQSLHVWELTVLLSPPLDQMSAWLISFEVFGNLRRVWMVSSLYGPHRRTAWPSVITHR